MVLFGGVVHALVVDADSPTTHGPHQDQLALLIRDHNHPAFLLDHLRGTNPLAIGYSKMIHASINFTISPRTTVSKLGINCRCGCLIGLTSSSIKILWEQKDGLIPLMSVIFHVMARQYFFSRATSLLFCSGVRSELIMTGSLFPSRRNAYSM
ncbi:unnamed protein product [Linum trigynum]|uniref:Uncharacterized protein n=1 Tax=Linum trigynum TaxID=586398 RepID=A0AAV2GKR4_9ROSI